MEKFVKDSPAQSDADPIQDVPTRFRALINNASILVRIQQLAEPTPFVLPTIIKSSAAASSLWLAIPESAANINQQFARSTTIVQRDKPATVINAEQHAETIKIACRTNVVCEELAVPSVTLTRNAVKDSFARHVFVKLAAEPTTLVPAIKLASTNNAQILAELWVSADRVPNVTSSIMAYSAAVQLACREIL